MAVKRLRQRAVRASSMYVYTVSWADPRASTYLCLGAMLIVKRGARCVKWRKYSLLSKVLIVVQHA